MLYVIGDMHLSIDGDKKMDIFPGWQGYEDRLKAGFMRLNDDDLCVLCGDSSWGMSLAEGISDFKFINELPGKKLLLKGNHDYWWTTAAKMQAFFEENKFESISLLHNNAIKYGDKWLCGTRGWLCGDIEAQNHDAKIMRRECMRLETSLKSAGEGEKICFFHYPPKHKGGEFTGLIEIMVNYGVKRCYFGHIHSSDGAKTAYIGEYAGIEFRLISADFIGFEPQLIG